MLGCKKIKNGPLDSKGWKLVMYDVLNDCKYICNRQICSLNIHDQFLFIPDASSSYVRFEGFLLISKIFGKLRFVNLLQRLLRMHSVIK